MKKSLLIILISSLFVLTSFSQEKSNKSSFWDKVQYGGGFNVGFSNTATVIGISPNAIYNFNNKFGAGIGVSYMYAKYKNSSTALKAYGGSLLALYKPFVGMQLSTEFEETFVKRGNLSTQIPALYLGAGYNVGRNISAGIRYDVLYDDNKSLYASPLTPFVRISF